MYLSRRSRHCPKDWKRDASSDVITVSAVPLSRTGRNVMTNNQFAYHVSDHSHQLAQKTWTQVQDQCLKSFSLWVLYLERIQSDTRVMASI